MTDKLADVASLKVEYYPDQTDRDGLAVILIRATGQEGLERAKARANHLSKSTGDLSYVVGSNAQDISIGHIVYAEGRIYSRAGVFA